jgi:DNA-binding PadR family transcriptional regulator
MGYVLTDAEHQLLAATKEGPWFPRDRGTISILDSLARRGFLECMTSGDPRHPCYRITDAGRDLLASPLVYQSHRLLIACDHLARNGFPEEAERFRKMALLMYQSRLNSLPDQLRRPHCTLYDPSSGL